MQLTAIGLATALALTSTTAFAMGGGGAGASGGVGSSYTSNPAECGGLVCFCEVAFCPDQAQSAAQAFARRGAQGFVAWLARRWLSRPIAAGERLDPA
jgi:hypothetical protein